MKALWADPYRPFFALFPVAGALLLAAWSRALSAGPAVATAEHGAAMIWGVYGSAVIGFLMTAYPRQNDAPSPPPWAVGALFAGHLVTIVALVASWLGAPTGAAATVLGLVVWGALAVYALTVAIPSLRRKWDDTTALVAVGALVAAVGWATVRLGAPRWGLALGLHGFLVLVALGLLDRLLPFFTSRVVPGYDGVRKRGWLVRLAGAMALRIALDATPMVPDLLLVAVIAWQWHGWRPRAGLRVPMVAVLHLGVAWLVLGYALDATGLTLRTLPLHLWTVGGMGTLLFGLATRVTLGHGGMPLRLGVVGAVAMGLVQAAVVARGLLPLVPGLPYVGLLQASALLLGLAFVVWGARFGPLLVRKG